MVPEQGGGGDDPPPAESDVMRVLVATDNHLGYGEKNPVKADDSFVTFDEILEIALREEVDFVLLGGDLFHENKPSRQSYVKCVQILRDRVFGDRPISVHLVSDPEANFSHCTGRKDVNYTDPNLNIGLPIFSVHGNHDDPAGAGGYCVLDNLHAAGLVNYFGKSTNLKEVAVSPLLLVKGAAKLALYGLSSLKDERLHRLFRENKVHFYRPEEDTESWFNLLVLHQNRARRGPPTNHIPEHFVEGFFDLVVWGHEHDCRITPEKVVCGEDKVFHVTQPGSSVATSLCEGEAVPKKVAVLEIHGRRFKMKEVALRTVRPMVFRSISLADEEEELEGAALQSQKKQQHPKRAQQKVEQLLRAKVEEMIEKEAPKLITGDERQPKLPSVRLRVEYSDENHQLNVARFGNGFADRVANPGEILLFRKRVERREGDGSMFDEGVMERLKRTGVAGSSMEDLIAAYFRQAEGAANKELKLLGVGGISAAVKGFIEKNDRDAVGFMVEMQLKKALECLEAEGVDDEGVDDALATMKAKRDGADPSAAAALGDPELRGRRGEKAKRREAASDESDPSAPSEDEAPPPPPPTRGRGRGGGRGRGSTRGSKKKTPVVGAKKDATQSSIRSMFSSQRSSSSAAAANCTVTSGRSTTTKKKKKKKSSVVYETSDSEGSS